MGQFTPNLNLYKAGGGSTGLVTPDEVADIDKAVNANLDKIDAWAGPIAASLPTPVTTGIVSGTSALWEVTSQSGVKANGAATVSLVVRRLGGNLDMTVGGDFDLSGLSINAGWRPLNIVLCRAHVGTNATNPYGEAGADGFFHSDGTIHMRRNNSGFGNIELNDYVGFHLSYVLAP